MTNILKFRCDYIPNFSQNISEYEAILQEISSKKSGQYLYVKNKQIKVVGRIQKLFQNFLGWIGFINHTHSICVTSTLMKFLYHGEVQGYLSNDKIKVLVLLVKEQMKNSKNTQDLNSFIDQIYTPEVDSSIHIQKLRERLVNFHNKKDVQQKLSIKSATIADFGTTYFELAKKYNEKNKGEKALQQYIHARELKKLDQSYQNRLIKEFVLSFLPVCNLSRTEALPFVHSLIDYLFENKNYELALELSRKALNRFHNDSSLKPRYVRALFHCDKLDGWSPDLINTLSCEIENFEKNMKKSLSPSEKVKKEIADIYYIRAIQAKDANFIHYLEMAVELDPNCDNYKEKLFEAYLEAANKRKGFNPLSYIFSTNSIDSIELLEKAVDLAPNKFGNHILLLIKHYGPLNNIKAITLYEQWKQELNDPTLTSLFSIELMKTAVDLLPNKFGDHIPLLVKHYGSLKDIKAIALYEQWKQELKDQTLTSLFSSQMYYEYALGLIANNAHPISILKILEKAHQTCKSKELSRKIINDTMLAIYLKACKSVSINDEYLDYLNKIERIIDEGQIKFLTEDEKFFDSFNKK